MILTARKSSVDDIALRTGYAQTFAVLKEFDCTGIAQSEGDVLLAFPRKSLSAFDDALLHDGTVNRDERPTAIVETRLNVYAVTLRSRIGVGDGRRIVGRNGFGCDGLLNGRICRCNVVV